MTEPAIRGPVVLHSDRLLIRTLGPAGAPRVVSWLARSRAHLEPWSTFPEGFFTVPYWERRLAAADKALAEGRGVSFWLILEEDESDGPDGRIIGACNYSNIVRSAFQACHLGYNLDPSFEGRGYMREALQTTLAYMFDTVGLHRVMANYMPDNLRSGGLLRRLGFVVEGYAKDYLFINGAWRDHVLTALVNPNPTDPVS